MTKKADIRPDKQITREIHKLFWSATFTDKPGIIITYLTRMPALVLYNIFIPLQIAYGLQAVFNQQFDKVPGYALNILGLAAGYAVLWAIGCAAVSRNGRIGTQYIQRKVFANYLNKDYEFYSNTFFGALGSQAVQLRSVFIEYSQITTLHLPSNLTVIVAGIVVIGYHSLLLALLTLASMAAVLSFTIGFSAWRLRLRRSLSEASSELAGVVGDSLSHGTTIKSFASEEYEQENLTGSLSKWANSQYKTWMSSIPADSGRMILAALATSIMLLVTARLYKDQTITVAIVALVQLYVIKMITATEALATLVKQYETVMGGAYQAVKTMLVPATVLDKPITKRLPKGGRLGIDFKSIGYRYADASEHSKAVSNFSLNIAPGEKIGLVGYSGSGKTTLTKLLLRFMDVTDGSISISGVDIRDLSQHDLRTQIAYVPQEPLLFHRTINENIAYSKPAAAQKDIQKAAKMAYVDEFANELPNGYKTMVGERGVKLSGGQRQRVAIARALLKNAPILILDEATSALDSRSERLIQQALWRLMKNRTALVVAHRLSTIQRMDRIVVMDKGRITQIGTHEELLEQKGGIYAKLWAHQSGGYVGLPDKDKTDTNS